MNSLRGANSLASGFELIHESKSKRAVLLFHGLTGSPFEMQKYGKFIHSKGYDVFGICMPGHGEYQKDIYTVTYNEWIDCATNKLNQLCNEYEEVFLSGLCLGAVLSLALAEKYPEKVKGIVLFSTTLYLDGWRLPWYKILMPIGLHTIFRYFYTYPECEPYGVKNERTRASIKRILAKPDVGMDNYPMSAFYELLELSKTVRANFEKVTCPALIIHSREDDLTSLKSANETYNKISSKDKELIVLENSYHMVLYDNEKEFVFNKALSFFDTHSITKDSEKEVAV